MARIAMVGMGNRGSVYGRHARTLGGEVVAVAEPRSRLRDRLSDLWGVPEAGRFADWQQLVEAEPAVDLVFIATQDQLHRDPAVAFLEAGYDVVLEKPMAPTEEDSRAILDAASRSGRHLVVAHVLRYQPYSRMVMRLISEGAIGSVTHLDHFEPIGDQHFAHSYVRGNWRREEEASSALMSKSCHDLDWICAVVGSQATSVASFGSLSHFKEANAPEGAGHRCLDCAVEADCAFSARRFYMAALESESGWDWPLSVVAEEPTQAAVTEALLTSPYGRCVYRCDNDVVDHQVVALQFVGGQTASFTMSAFSKPGHRRTRIGGTRGYLVGDGEQITVFDYLTQTETVTHVAEGSGPDAGSGHGGGDFGLVETVLDAVDRGNWEMVPTDAAESFATHQLVWAAERSRKTGTVVNLS